MHRTIIDILRKGNQELFHSSIIAWLLDPNGEHGYETGFLDEFALLVEEKGEPRFRVALKASQGVKITTETTSRKSRYDIRLDIGNTVVVIENKVKSLGEEPQFEKYKGENTVLVALGLCDLSFSEQVKGMYPLVTYADVLAILDQLPESQAFDFKVLVDHYRQFLRRELAVLDYIDHWYAAGDSAHASEILALVDDCGTYSQNDQRFLNYYLLARCRRDLLQSSRWKHCLMPMDKNRQSGVYLAIFDVAKEPGTFRYDDLVTAVCNEHSASSWFHVELWGGVLTKDGEGIAGRIQLRCKTKTATEFVEAFRLARPSRKDETSPKKPKKEADSFYILARPLLKKHLTASQLRKQLDEFAESLGKFG